MRYICCALIGYFIGTINPSYLIAKKKGFDIRQKGSGNAGASNALILFGKLTGVVCALFDIAKAYLSILLAETLFPNVEYVFAITSVACVLGHVYPFYMKFEGGKGLACLGGIVLAFHWKVFLMVLAAEIVIALITDYICAVPLTASVAFPLIYVFIKRDIFGACILAVIAVVMVSKHVENLRRIRNGTEMRLSYLWKPDAEIERLKENLSENPSTVDELFSEKTTVQ